VRAPTTAEAYRAAVTRANLTAATQLKKATRRGQRYRPPLTEAAWQRKVIAHARKRGWLVYHAPPVKLPDGRWATPQSDGFPDLTLGHPRWQVIVTVELKTDDAPAPTGRQRLWQNAGALLWRPRDWATRVQPFLDGVGR
jgi:hypothetical protein